MLFVASPTWQGLCGACHRHGAAASGSPCPSGKDPHSFHVALRVAGGAGDLPAKALARISAGGPRTLWTRVDVDRVLTVGEGSPFF